MSYQVARYRTGRGDSEPLKRAFAAYLNDYAQALRRNDLALQQEIASIVEEIIPELEHSPEVLAHDNPAMLRAAMKAAWCYQRRQFPEAKQLDSIALLEATYPPTAIDSAEKSARIAGLASNLCSECVQLAISNHEGRRKDWQAESVKWGHVALSHAPGNPEYRLELGCAEDEAGFPDAAEKTIAPVVPLINFSDPSNALAARVRFHDDLLRRKHLPSVQKILKMISAH